MGHPPHATDLKATWADIAKAGRLLNWSPQVTRADGFRKAMDWHVANLSWLKDIKL